MENFGIILKRLRQINELGVKKAAQKIGKSSGWLSEVESKRGRSRLTRKEFERIVQEYGGEKYRIKFPAWIAAEKKNPETQRKALMRGPVYKYLRKKRGWSQEKTGKALGISKSQVSKIETSKVTPEKSLHESLVKLYGYSPDSFKNFTTADKRAKSIPTRFKVDALISHCSSETLEAMLKLGLEGSS